MTAQPRQWPDDICSGPIRYGPAHNYDGFYLADAMHGIPTFGSVSPTDPVTIKGQHVLVFNYPGQTEEIAKQLVHRWNCHAGLIAALTDLCDAWDGEDGGRLRGSITKAVHIARETIASAETP